MFSAAKRSHVPGYYAQKVTIGGLGVVDVDTWEAAGNINCSYQRGVAPRNVMATPECREPIGFLVGFFVANHFHTQDGCTG